jgi:hypothetical protein
VLESGARVLAIAPAPAAAGVPLTVDARLPDGRRQRVLAFTPRAGWERRYWFETPLEWPRGTELQVHLALDDESARPAPGAPLLIVDTAATRP